jgi:hypothetical protein
MPVVEYPPGAAFPGVIGRTADESTPAWPAPVRARESALTCGTNPGSAITDDYSSPFKFTGTIHSVTVDVSGELIHDDAELRMHMARR